MVGTDWEEKQTDSWFILEVKLTCHIDGLDYVSWGMLSVGLEQLSELGIMY